MPFDRKALVVAALLLLAGAARLPAQAPPAEPSRQAPPRQQWIAYLDSLAARRLTLREREVAALRTRADAERRQAASRATVLRLIGGLPGDASPLRVRSFGTVPGDGFRVEKITYESLPGFLVTANVYVPSGGGGPFPAVILTPGHDPSGKQGLFSFAANLARAGFVALAYDPMSEGERLQYFDADLGVSRVGRPTGEHSHAGVQTMLLGDHVSRYFVRDASRGVDYLASRPDVDSARIGAFGCSGGGTVTSYLTALDDRIKAAVSACYLTTFRELLAAGDPQEAEQTIPYFIEQGLDLADWIHMAAPRPYAIVSTTEDMFPFEGARRVYEEARRVYGLHGAADRIQWITGPGGHGALGPVSADIVGFFARWLKGDATKPSFKPMRPANPDDLLVTETGQLASSLGSETVHTVNRARARELLRPRQPIRTRAELERLQATLREDVRTVARTTVRPGDAAPAVRVLRSEAPREGYRLDSVAIPVEGNIELPGLLAVPEGTGPKRTLLLMDPEPREALAAVGGQVDRLAREGWMVLVLQPRGTPGGAEAMKSPLMGHAYFLALRAALVGKTIVGMRTDDALHAVNWLWTRPEVDRSALAVYGVGPLGPVALHAAALDARIGSVYVERALTSYREGVERALHRDLSEVALPGVLLRYDLGDLMLAASPRRVVVVNPVDVVGERVRERAFRRELAYVFESDRLLGWPDRVRVVTRGVRDPLPVQ